MLLGSLIMSGWKLMIVEQEVQLFKCISGRLGRLPSETAKVLHQSLPTSCKLFSSNTLDSGVGSGVI